MMPAFTTPDGGSPDALDTVDTKTLTESVDKMIKDGANAIATMGSFGEFHTLLWEEKKNHRSDHQRGAPARAGFHRLHDLSYTRDYPRGKIRSGSRRRRRALWCAVLLPSTVENAVQFYDDIADAFPRLGIGIYHNPPLHKITLPVSAFEKLITRPNIVFMKDSHRTPLEFAKLIKIVKDKISVFVMQAQMYPYMQYGASGCWSICAWMGPSPLFRLRDACAAGDWETAKQICIDMSDAYKSPGRPGDLLWRENSHKLVINDAGYCHAGPLRPPFRHVPAEIIEHSKQMAEYWKKLCAKYPAK